MKQEQLYQIAIHEAGHAVIAVVLGQKFRNVSIKAKDDYLGRVKYWTSKKNLIDTIQGLSDSYPFLKNETIDKRVRKALQISYAGYIAEQKTGVDNQEGATTDFAFITDTALSHAGEGEADKLCGECLQATKQLVDKNWNHIEAVAQQLLEKKTISGKDVLKIMSGENGDHTQP